MPIGRPRSRPGYAAPGQYICRFNFYDETADRATICGAEVPEGELTYLAHNTRSGAYLALCARHREALAQTVEDWLSAATGVGRLLASLTELPDGRLVSQTELREVLLKLDLARGNGPLTTEQQFAAIKIKYGEEMAEQWVQAQRG